MRVVTYLIDISGTPHITISTRSPSLIKLVHRLSTFSQIKEVSVYKVYMPRSRSMTRSRSISTSRSTSRSRVHPQPLQPLSIIKGFIKSDQYLNLHLNLDLDLYLHLGDKGKEHPFVLHSTQP